MKNTVKRLSAMTATALITVTALAGSATIASAKTPTATKAPTAYTQTVKNTAKTVKVTAYGKTSYGYNWTYSTTNNVVKVKVNYDFKTHKYTFTLNGIKAGKATMRLVYFTSDDKYETIDMKISVDKKMNVTRLS